MTTVGIKTRTKRLFEMETDEIEITFDSALGKTRTRMLVPLIPERILDKKYCSCLKKYMWLVKYKTFPVEEARWHYDLWKKYPKMVDNYEKMLCEQAKEKMGQ